MERKLTRRRLLGAASAFAGGSALAATTAVAAKASIAIDSGQEADDAAILTLFQDWTVACRVTDEVLVSIPEDATEDPPEWDSACDRVCDIEDRIFQCRGGPAGLAIKAFIQCYRENSNWTPQQGHIRLEGEGGQWDVSILRDAAALVPEIGERAAAVIHDDAPLIDADMQVQWAMEVLAMRDPYLSGAAERQADVRNTLRAALDRIANTPAKTPRGAAIKARHAGAVA
jgi:hypothetical protein